MHPQIPPPDPHERDDDVLPGLELADDSVLAYRPGALLVYDTRQ